MSRRYESGNPKCLLALWQANPHCHWCGIPTELPPSGVSSKTRYNTATRDHIRSKMHPAHQGSRSWVVLACNRCNSIRGSDEHAIVTGESKHPRHQILRLIAESLVST